MYKRLQKLVLFLVGATVPLQGFAFRAVGLNATPFKVMTAVLFGLAMLRYATRARGGWRDRKSVWMVAFLVSLGVATTMAIVAGLPPGPVARTVTTQIALVSFYFLLGYVLETKEDLILLLWAFVIGSAITVGGGAGNVDPTAWEGGRYQGLSGQDNLLASDMNVCLMVAFALFFRSRSKLQRLLLVGAGASALVGIALALSRAAFLGLGAMWAFWLYRSGRRGNIQYAVLAVMIGMVSLVFAPESVFNRMDTVIDPAKRAADGSIQGRLVIDAWAVRAFISNPLAGVGTPRFATWVHQHPGTDFVSWHTVHSAYLSIAAEQGLLGLVPFLMLLWLTWSDYSWSWRATRARRQMADPVLKEFEHIALFLQLALISAMVAGLFHQEHRAKTLWLVMAVSPVVAGLVRERVEALQGSVAREEPIFPRAPEPAGAVLARSSPG
jgi:O-antigen ligase